MTQTVWSSLAIGCIPSETPVSKPGLNRNARLPHLTTLVIGAAVGDGFAHPSEGFLEARRIAGYSSYSTHSVFQIKAATTGRHSRQLRIFER